MDPADPLLPKILVLVILILINAFFAAAEIAVISLSETKLRKQAEEGDRKAKKLLVLMQAPDSFLSAIQIAITLAGFLSSAFAADSFSDPLVHWLTVDKGFTAIPTSTLNTIMVVLITIVLSYFSLVLGELVPKRIAMKKTEAVARFTVGAVTSVAAVFRPVIWLLSKSTNGVLRLLHIDPKADEEDVSEDEIRMMVDLGEERGAIESNEKELIDNIFEFNNTTAEDVMIHRTDMVMLWVEDTREEILATIRSSGLSRFPVYEENADDIIGILSTREYLLNAQAEAPKPMRELLRPAYFVPESVRTDVLFRDMQNLRRVGLNGKEFNCYKVRSMCVDADVKLKELLERDPEARKEWETEFKLKNDPRITKSGAFLRKTSLDELPQLFNVLKGEMSLVGPRPIIQDEVPKYGPYIKDFYMVRPGVTGMWQTSGRSDTTYDERVQMDTWYVRNWNVWFDIVLIWRTIAVVLKHKGAY